MDILAVFILALLASSTNTVSSAPAPRNFSANSSKLKMGYLVELAYGNNFGAIKMAVADAQKNGVLSKLNIISGF